MRFFYNIFILLYEFSAGIAALFSKKARLWKTGRNGIMNQIRQSIKEKDPEGVRKRAWFHCASLGEFEQGRPVIEAYRQKYPENLIIVTFYSPSGYEVRKNSALADIVCYLPSDTPRNADEFVSFVDPEVAVFVKYEFWYNYLAELRKHRKRVFFISVILRPSQIFFKWYGNWFRNQLVAVTWFFLQDEASLVLFKEAGLSNCTVSGDTRFDRVYSVSREARSVPMIDEFCSGKKILIAGSTWPEDEKILFSTINKGEMKVIIAPHETEPSRIRSLMQNITRPAVKYSEINAENSSSSDVLIIDSIGILSYIYRYGDVAYIGGGFGVGIHNILEAAAFGIPVIFGPNYGKFREAHDLIRLGGAFSVSTETQLVRILDKTIQNGINGSICGDYVAGNQGATRRIMEYL